MIIGIYPTICTDDVAATRDFYVDLFGFRVVFDSGWYVQLEAPDGSRPQIGIVEREHPSVPERFRQHPAGILVAIEVKDVDAVHERARTAGLPEALSLRSEEFGQRHFMTVDPSGTVVDVITQIPPSAEYAEAYAAALRR